MWKKHKLILLPSEGKSIFGLLGKVNKLHIYKNDEFNTLLDELAHPHHLYLLSDDEIKDKDWCILFDNFNNVMSNPQQYNKSKNHVLNNGLKKITATTNSSLRIKEILDEEDTIHHFLPQFSKEFIEQFITEYNKGNVITDIMVECETNYVEWKHSNKESLKETLKLKINSKDNTINIKPIKDSWNREEVIKLFKEHNLNINKKHNLSFIQEFTDKWIKENL